MRIEDKFKPARRAPIWASVPDEKWNDWRWQLTNRLNSVDELEQVIHLLLACSVALRQVYGKRMQLRFDR